MRALSYILIVLGVCLLTLATFDEIRGITHKPIQLLRIHGSRSNSGYLDRFVVRRSQQPQLFRQFMTTHWIYAGVIEAVGVALFLTSMPPKDEPDQD